MKTSTPSEMHQVPDLFRERPRPVRPNGRLPGLSADQESAFQETVTRIWDELLIRFRRPIEVRHTLTRRSITVLGTFRFLEKNAGEIALHTPNRGSAKRRSFRNSGFVFAVDLPLAPKPALFLELLMDWQPALAPFQLDLGNPGPAEWALATEFGRALLSTLYWRRFRYAVRAALALDADVLNLARRSRTNVHGREVTSTHYHYVLHDIYPLLCLRRDAPGLLWLAGLAREEGRSIPWGGRDPLGALRQSILDGFQLPPSAWRHLLRGGRRGFRVVLDWLGPNGTPKGRWLELRDWLRLLVALKRKAPVPLAVQRLFLHDHYRLEQEGSTVRFRNARVPVASLRQILAEAEERARQGTLAAFAAQELPDVLAWLDTTGTVPDARQQKAGWRWLVRRALEWKHDQDLREQGRTLCWDSLVRPQALGTWRLRPLTDVWQVHREALTRRNCVNQYVSDCKGGSVRLFALERATGQQVATFGLKLNGGKWEVLDARGFANRSLSQDMLDLAQDLATRYTDMWRLLSPLPAPAPAEVPAPDPTESLEEAQEMADEEESDMTVSDEDGEDAYPGQDCPICGDEQYSCDHLIAAMDYYNGGLFAGALYSREPDCLEMLWQLVFACARSDRQYTGHGDPLDEVMAETRTALERGENPEDVRDSNAWRLQHVFCEMTEYLPGVDVRYWEFDGGMPGTATCGRNYWSDDPDQTLAALRERLAGELAAAGSNWATSRDEG